MDLWLRSERARFRSGGEEGEGIGRLKVLRDGAAKTGATLLLPVESALGFPVSLPARSRRQLVRALPFAVEEKIATDLDTMHIAYGDIKVGEPVAVRTLERESLRSALVETAELNLELVRVALDADALRLADCDIVILLTDDLLLLKDRIGRVAGLPRQGLLLAVTASARHFRQEEAEKPVRLRICLDVGQSLSEIERAQLEGELHIPIELQQLSSVWDAFDFQAAVNLRQGDFAAPRQGTFSFGPWRAAAAAAGVLLALFAIVEVGKGFWYASKAADVNAQAEALYRELFPDTQNISNLRSQFVQRIGGSVEGGSPRTMLASLAKGFAGQSGFQLESVSFLSERNELSVQLMAPSLAALDELKARLVSDQQPADINSAEQVGEAVRARLKLSGSSS